jgi:antitoxin (DNA-binding transcriptional repressor) of toxin-antitoxin stability system
MATELKSSLRVSTLLDNVVTRHYIGAVKTAGVRELKARLSAYLRDVASGEVVLVTDRGRVVAEIRPPGVADASASPAQLRYRKLVERGVIRLASNPEDRSWANGPSLGVAPGTLQEFLDAERGE